MCCMFWGLKLYSHSAIHEKNVTDAKKKKNYYLLAISPHLSNYILFDVSVWMKFLFDVKKKN